MSSWKLIMMKLGHGMIGKHIPECAQHMPADLVRLRGDANLDDPAFKGQQRHVGGQLWEERNLKNR